jgi:two-component system, NtrC family, sensor histidine kinase KinB
MAAKLRQLRAGRRQVPGLLSRFRQYIVKYLLLFVCIVFFIGYAFYTRYVIERLHQDAIDVTQTYAELMRTAITENMSDGEMNVVFEEVIRKATNPIVVTDTTWRPILWKNIKRGPIYSRTPVPINDTTSETIRYIDSKIVDFRRTFEPKPLVVEDSGTPIGYLVFGPSDLVTSLRWVPFLGITVIVLFLIFSYLIFNTMRTTERTNLWAGLAKETAHQLGTPISSLMGWVEFMKAMGEEQKQGQDEGYARQVVDICDNMEHDLTRLRKITNRFSQIGSLPALVPTDLNSVIKETTNYLKLRLPVLRKRIEIKTALGEIPPVDLNRDLIEWVFENLMKNSINAIKRDDGLIEILTEYIEVDGLVRVSHCDNGSGIARKVRGRIFSPGFTTKKRGWGLGLTLAKRIVEDYHGGSIHLSRSQADRETVFHVDLPVSASAARKWREGSDNGGIAQERAMG